MGTDKGDILVVENGDVRGNLTLDPAGPCAIAAIVATPKVCSMADACCAGHPCEGAPLLV